MKNPIAQFRGLKLRNKAVVLLGSAFLFYILFGFLAAPLILKTVLEKKIPQLLNRQVSIGKVRLNPFALSATVEEFRLADSEGTGEFVSFDRLYVNVESLSIFKKALIVRSISLSGPTLDISRLDDQTYSFSDLLAEQGSVEPEQEESGKALFSINNIEIAGGTIRYRDIPKNADHLIADLTLAIPAISSLPSNIESEVQPVFSAVINGTPISLDGGSKLFAESRVTELKLKMSGINIPEYLPYIPNPTRLRLKSALLDIDTRLTYRLLADQTSRLSLIGTVTLRALEVTDDAGHSYLRLPSVTAVLADSDLLAKEIRLTEVSFEAPQMEVSRLAGGEILPFDLLARADSAPAVEAVQTEETEAPATDPLRMTIDRFHLSNGEVTFRDGGLKKPATVRIAGIDLRAEDLSTISGTTGAIGFSLGVNKSGRLSGNGALVLNPLALKTTVSVESLNLPDFQPYVAEYARIILAGGTFALQGELELRPDEAGVPGPFFAGECSLAGLDTRDSMNGDDLLKWKMLQVSQIVYSGSPDELSIGEIRLEAPYVGVLINEDGTPNFSTLAEPVPKKDEPAGAAPGAGAESPAERKITIGKVAIHKGKVQFLDRSIKPSYGVSLDQVNGRLAGLSSQPGKLGTVKLDARLDRQAPLIISGEINPLISEPYVDLTVDFKDFNLSPLSPYSGRHLGNKIEKGKLNFDLHYQIRGNLLESSNKVFLDQFTLGEGVESPDATSLPVGLAIALLKNRQGEIFLDIPVRGDLNDPEFSVGGVVIQVLVNLISKAATSPFSLLGSLIPEGNDLQHVVFAPGLAELTAKETEKLALVANVLHERPGLRMDISGHADPRLDSLALSRSRLLQLVKLEKLRETGGRKGAVADHQSIVVSDKEYPGYLERIYRKALKAAPEGETPALLPAGADNEAAAVAQMENYLLRGLPIAEEELRLLALTRANAILSNLVDAGKIEAGRLFVIEPQLAASGSGEESDGMAMTELLIK